MLLMDLSHQALDPGLVQERFGEPNFAQRFCDLLNEGAHTMLGFLPTGMAPGALGNAIADALESFGVVLRELPFSRERIWRLVAEAKGRVRAGA